MTPPDPDDYFAQAVDPEFRRIFGHIAPPDPLPDHEAIEGIAVMVEQEGE